MRCPAGPLLCGTGRCRGPVGGGMSLTRGGGPRSRGCSPLPGDVRLWDPRGRVPRRTAVPWAEGQGVCLGSEAVCHVSRWPPTQAPAAHVPDRPHVCSRSAAAPPPPPMPPGSALANRPLLRWGLGFGPALRPPPPPSPPQQQLWGGGGIRGAVGVAPVLHSALAPASALGPPPPPRTRPPPSRPFHCPALPTKGQRLRCPLGLDSGSLPNPSSGRQPSPNAPCPVLAQGPLTLARPLPLRRPPAMGPTRAVPPRPLRTLHPHRPPIAHTLYHSFCSSAQPSPQPSAVLIRVHLSRAAAPHP